jgi:microcystin-dependent protein
LPSDANGNYSLPGGYLAVTGETILASQHNPPLEDLASSMSLRLMRSGAAAMTGPLKLADGAVGTPGMAFGSATSTGIYKTTAGIGFSVGGTQVAELSSGGFKSGALPIGSLVPFTGTSAPALYVLPYGQTLSRATYADLWAFAQSEIAAGNAFYNNGNGSTTFGVGDLRGRVLACKDNLGGTPAGRLSFGPSDVDGQTLGAVGGAQNITLLESQIPSHVHGNTLTDNGHAHSYTRLLGGLRNDGTSALTVNTNQVGDTTGSSQSNITINNAAAGGGLGHMNVQPTIVVSYVLFAGA